MSCDKNSQIPSLHASCFRVESSNWNPYEQTLPKQSVQEPGLATDQWSGAIDAAMLVVYAIFLVAMFTTPETELHLIVDRELGFHPIIAKPEDIRCPHAILDAAEFIALRSPYSVDYVVKFPRGSSRKKCVLKLRARSYGDVEILSAETITPSSIVWQMILLDRLSKKDGYLVKGEYVPVFFQDLR